MPAERRFPLAAGRQHSGDPQQDEIWRQIRQIIDYLGRTQIPGDRYEVLLSDGSGGLLSVTAGANGQVLTLSSGIPRWANAAAGGGSPGAPDKSLQWANGSSFAGEALWLRESAGRIGVALAGYHTWGANTAIYPNAGFLRVADDGTTKVLISQRANGANYNVLDVAANTGQVTLTSPTSINITTASGVKVANGAPSYQGSKFRVFPVLGELTTSNTTQQVLASYTMVDESHCRFDAIVTMARQTTANKSGDWTRKAAYYRTGGGNATLVGSVESGNDARTTTGDDVTISASGTSVRVLVTAADANGRNWACELRVQETLAT